MSEPVRGIIVRPEGSELVIKPATEDDVRRFARGQEVTLTTPQAGVDFWAGVLDGDHLFYDRHGTPVAVIRSLETSMDIIDATTFGGERRRYLSGRRRIEGRFEGI